MPGITTFITESVPEGADSERGVYSVGYNTDMSVFAPKAHLVAAVWNWTPFYKDVIAKVRAGTWKSGSYWPGLESGIIDISTFGPMVPAEVREQVLKRKEEILNGQFVVFAGPVKDQKGTVRIEAGKKTEDKNLLNMNWFVEGVVGSTE